MPGKKLIALRAEVSARRESRLAERAADIEPTAAQVRQSINAPTIWGGRETCIACGKQITNGILLRLGSLRCIDCRDKVR